MLPCWYLLTDGACACGGRPDCRPGKHPIPRHGVHDATTDADTIRRWWSEHPSANVALAMGDGVVTIDVDPRNGGDATFARLESEHGAIHTTPRARTGGGGLHVFVQVESAFRTTKLAGGIELIGDGSYVLAAPSRTTGPYEWIVAPWEAALTMAPAWVLEARRETAPVVADTPQRTGDVQRRIVRARGYLAKMEPAIAGSGGHAATWRAACAMVRRFGLLPDEALTLLVGEYNPRCKPPWSLRELRHKVQDAAKSTSPHWLADSARPEERGRPGGDLDPWTRSIRVRVGRAIYEPPPSYATAHRVRLECVTADGEVLPRQYVVLPVAGHGTARAIFDATIGDVAPPEAWLAPDGWRLAERLTGRELEIVIPPGNRRASRMRRVG